jgi:hypothetical protein
MATLTVRTRRASIRIASDMIDRIGSSLVD